MYAGKTMANMKIKMINLFENFTTFVVVAYYSQYSLHITGKSYKSELCKSNILENPNRFLRILEA